MPPVLRPSPPGSLEETALFATLEKLPLPEDPDSFAAMVAAVYPDPTFAKDAGEFDRIMAAASMRYENHLRIPAIKLSLDGSPRAENGWQVLETLKEGETIRRRATEAAPQAR